MAKRKGSTRYRSKAFYISAIFTYKKRREALRVRYGGYRSKEYAKKSKGLTYKIWAWNQALRRIERFEQRVKELDKYVVEFFGTSARNGIWGRSEKKKLAKMFLCRACIEEGIWSKYVRQYMGSAPTARETVRSNRNRLIKLSQHDMELSKLWRQFNEFIKQET